MIHSVQLCEDGGFGNFFFGGGSRQSTSDLPSKIYQQSRKQWRRWSDRVVFQMIHMAFFWNDSDASFATLQSSSLSKRSPWSGGVPPAGTLLGDWNYFFTWFPCTVMAVMAVVAVMAGCMWFCCQDLRLECEYQWVSPSFLRSQLRKNQRVSCGVNTTFDMGITKRNILVWYPLLYVITGWWFGTFLFSHK